ncbi:unnamed protein product [Bursaphelenchus okinawaensis]|uniref:Ribosomal protein/NADH dehydrogenase domain-containing protein n=1 Tax=Bursaphelenchus okinawaensis TaxID=465554 RepID=A0A811KTX2_9BILA|nr:unnamed protein product [Bursaphelenchus okinawaensis]CAG9113174.1 unnamed protein product [Bursaphelenchus okinawaensis]
MCKMWSKIRFGVRWKPAEAQSLAVRGLDLKGVKAIKISMDPLRNDTTALRQFWHACSAPRAKFSNPAVKITPELRNDGKPAYFEADLADGKKLRFMTEGMRTADVVMKFNLILGNPPIGKAGIRPIMQ